MQRHQLRHLGLRRSQPVHRFVEGQQVVLTANTKYYGGAPKVPTLEFRVIPDESSILSGMKAGAFQLGIISDPGVAQPAGTNANYKLDKQPALSYHALMLNGRKGPLQNQQVRQAIACAVDRNQVLQTAAYGDGTVTGPITSPGTGWLYRLTYHVHETRGKTGATLTATHIALSNGTSADGNFTGPVVLQVPRVPANGTITVETDLSVLTAAAAASHVVFTVTYVDDIGQTGSASAAADIPPVAP